jgi:hypothetical protein
LKIKKWRTSVFSGVCEAPAESVNFILSREYCAGAAMGIMWWSHLSGAASNGKNFTVPPET